MHFPVTALGPGRRIGIWFQGCSIHCAGCISRDTWSERDGTPATVEDVLAQCRAWGDGTLGGVTISGGEPFDQPEALAKLLHGLALWRDDRKLDFDILCYSGYPEGRLRQRHPAIVARLDALVPEPFRRRDAPGGTWRGSANQPIVAITPLGAARYAEDAVAGDDPHMQFVVEDDTIWLIGVPRPGDLDRVEAHLLARGVELGGVSWR